MSLPQCHWVQQRAVSKDQSVPAELCRRTKGSQDDLELQVLLSPLASAGMIGPHFQPQRVVDYLRRIHCRAQHCL